MAEPSAGPCALAIVEIGRFSTSAYICIRCRFFSRPPAAMNSVTGSPAAANVSTMTRVPNAVASSSARYPCSGRVARVCPTMTMYVSLCDVVGDPR